MIHLFVKPFYLICRPPGIVPVTRWITKLLQYSSINAIDQSKNNRSSREIIQIVQTDEE